MSAKGEGNRSWNYSKTPTMPPRPAVTACASAWVSSTASIAAIEQARIRGLKSMVITFDEHPLSLLAPPYAPALMTTAEEKTEAIASYGIDLCLMFDFTAEFAATPAGDFIGKVLVEACQARYITCGEDFHFGNKGLGDIDLLKKFGARDGFDVEVCPALLDDLHPIKSTRIRQCIIDGEVTEAARLLGRIYTMRGRVVSGDRRGRTLGFPTANIEFPPRRLVPANGVYAVMMSMDGQLPRPGMMNIGVRPTFQGRRCVPEVHLFDFQGDLYGKDVELSFVRMIRPEQSFASPEALIARLHKDEQICRGILMDGDTPVKGED